MAEHPSRLALDRASLEAPPAEVAEHLSSCTECRAYLGRLREAPPVPAWARALEAKKTASFWGRFRLRPIFFTGGALAAACALLLMARTGYVGEKGLDAAFAVYVQRGEQQFLWDGAEKLRPLDRVQLKVETRGYRRATVGEVGSDGLVRQLYAAPLEEGAQLLPASWTLDAAPGPERLVVVFSQEPLSPERVADVARRQPRSRALWASVIELPKDAP